MEVGIVRSFNDEEGYGFIDSDDGDTLFVHHRSIEMEGFRTLSPGDKVFFDVVKGRRGAEAKNVRKL
jgi:cold shock protein